MFVIGGKFCHPVLISLAVVNKEIKININAIEANGQPYLSRALEFKSRMIHCIPALDPHYIHSQ